MDDAVCLLRAVDTLLRVGGRDVPDGARPAQQVREEREESIRGFRSVLLLVGVPRLFAFLFISSQGRTTTAMHDIEYTLPPPPALDKTGFQVIQDPFRCFQVFISYPPGCLLDSFPRKISSDSVKRPPCCFLFLLDMTRSHPFRSVQSLTGLFKGFRIISKNVSTDFNQPIAGYFGICPPGHPLGKRRCLQEQSGPT